MILNCLLLCLVQILAVTSQRDGCSISMFSRKTCKPNLLIVDATACINAGCCFDATQGIPATGKCYKRSNTNMFGTFGFRPTSAPSGILTVGGEPGYPGSKLTLECKPGKLCVSHGNYQDQRSTCLRQGCCWINGRCYQQTYKIIKLRNKCPPGFENPPACHVINPCDDSPCLNGGKCVFTGPAKFRCDCPVGFAGVICDNCKSGQLPILRGRRVPDKAEYKEGDYVQLECDADHAPQDGAVVARQCRDSNFLPPWSTHPFTCRAKCEVTKIENAETNRDVASGAVVSIKHGEDVTYACKNTFTSAAGTKLTRTCEDGKLTPALDVETIVCNADCIIKPPDFSSTTTTTSSVHHGEDVKFYCLETHKGSVVESTTRKCENGVFKPEFTSEVFHCTENCKVVAPTHGSVKGGKTDLKHTEAVEVECDPNHVLAGVSSGTCKDGKITPILTAVCKKPCEVLTVDGSTSQPTSGKVVHQASVVYTCNPNYKTPSSTDQFTSKCVDGVFSPPLETCLQQCQISEITNVKSVPAALQYIDHGEKVEFSCKSEFHTLDTMAERTCQLGKLQPAIDATNPFSCHADCKILPDITNSEFTVASRVKHGDKITIGCKSRHTLITDAVTRTCTSGSYLPDLDTKPAKCEPISSDCIFDDLTSGGSSGGSTGAGDTKKSYVAFVIDDTGSMGREIGACKIWLTNCANGVYDDCSVPPTGGWILSPYNDPGVGPVTGPTTDLAAILSGIADLSPNGGGDCPEKGMQGISDALVSVPIENSGCKIFYFTDATASDYHLSASVMVQVILKGCTFNPVLTGCCGTCQDPCLNLPPAYCKSNVMDTRSSDSTGVVSDEKGEKIYYDGAYTSGGKILLMDKDDSDNLVKVLESALKIVSCNTDKIAGPLPSGFSEERCKIAKQCWDGTKLKCFCQNETNCPTC